jgi:hypothetical protein
MSTKEIIDFGAEVYGQRLHPRDVEDWWEENDKKEDDDAGANSGTGIIAVVVRWCDRVDDRSSVRNAEDELQRYLAELKRVAGDYRDALRYFGSESASLVQALVEFGGAVFSAIGTQHEAMLRETLLTLAAWIAKMPRD